MKIGIDCRLWNETGVGRYTRNLVFNLQKIDKKNEYILFVLSKDKDKVQIQNPRFKIEISDIRWHTLKEQLKFPKILNKQNLDLMHFPYYSIPVFYKRPFVITIHDLIVNHYSTGKASALPSLIYKIKRQAYKYVLNKSVKNARKIIAVSNATKREIVNHLKVNEDKITVTYEGVDESISRIKNHLPANASHQAMQAGKSKIDGKYFLYVGNAYPHKNLERLLEAFKRLKPDTKLVFVGKKDIFYDRLRQKIDRLELFEKTIFLQNVSDEELSVLYKNAIALVFPSLMEGFGLPALEAMANNCLVLASDIPSLREVCRDAAIYFDPHNIDDIMEKMSEVCLNENDSYNNKKEEGLKRVKNFSWKKMAEETLRIYESCISL